MSSVQLLQFETERAKARELAAAKRKAMEDVSADDILSLSFKRELRCAKVEGVGQIYYYHPQSVAERDAYHKHVRFDGESARVSMQGIVDGIIARARTKNGATMFTSEHSARLLTMPAQVLLDIWHAFGEEQASSLESAEKK